VLQCLGISWSKLYCCSNFSDLSILRQFFWGSSWQRHHLRDGNSNVKKERALDYFAGLSLGIANISSLLYSQNVLYHPVVQMLFTLPDNLQTLSLGTDKTSKYHNISSALLNHLLLLLRWFNSFVKHIKAESFE